MNNNHNWKINSLLLLFSQRNKISLTFDSFIKITCCKHNLLAINNIAKLILLLQHLLKSLLNNTRCLWNRTLSTLAAFDSQLSPHRQQVPAYHSSRIINLFCPKNIFGNLNSIGQLTLFQSLTDQLLHLNRFFVFSFGVPQLQQVPPSHFLLILKLLILVKNSRIAKFQSLPNILQIKPSITSHLPTLIKLPKNSIHLFQLFFSNSSPTFSTRFPLGIIRLSLFYLQLFLLDEIRRTLLWQRIVILKLILLLGFFLIHRRILTSLFNTILGK